MITTYNLLSIGDCAYIGEEERVVIKKPKGGDLPAEWIPKLGEHRLPAPFVAAVEDVELCGPALVGLHKGDVILDTGYFGRLDLWERNYPYFEAALSCRNNHVETFELAVSFASVWSSNYFHWIVDTLPKLELIARTGLKPTILLGVEPPPFVIQYLRDQSLPYELVHRMRAKVKTLLVPTTRRKDGIPYPSAVRYLKRIALGDMVYTSPYLYISRKKATARRVVNEYELLDTLLPMGFTALMLEEMDVAQQRLYFAGAGLVVAPHGAGLANIVFGTPAVVELVTPAYTNPCAWLLGEVAGCDYRFLVGRKESQEDIRVNPEKVKELFDGITFPALSAVHHGLAGA